MLATHLARLSTATRSFTDVAHVPADAIDEDVTNELDRFKGSRRGPAIMVDLTGPSCIPVVRMVVPGLKVYGQGRAKRARGSPPALAEG